MKTKTEIYEFCFNLFSKKEYALGCYISNESMLDVADALKTRDNLLGSVLPTSDILEAIDRYDVDKNGRYDVKEFVELGNHFPMVRVLAAHVHACCGVATHLNWLLVPAAFFSSLPVAAQNEVRNAGRKPVAGDCEGAGRNGQELAVRL
jgi:hypothetical protein